MPSIRVVIDASTTASDALVGAATTAVGTVGVVFAVAVAVGFGILARRGRRGRRSPVTGGAADDLPQRANIALVRLDDDVAEMEDELGFAVAQFGEEKSARIASVLGHARRSLAASFALKQQLDDSVPDTAVQVREWNGRILMMCQVARESLSAERDAFDSLRDLERSAPADLLRVRAEAGAVRARLPESSELLERMAARHAPVAVASIAGNASAAARRVDVAEAAVTRAEKALGLLGGGADGAGPPASAEAAGSASGGPVTGGPVTGGPTTGAPATGVSASGGPASAGSMSGGAGGPGGSGVPVSALVQEAERAVRQAARMLDDIEAHQVAFEASASRLTGLVDRAKVALDDARPVRDSPPDPDTGTAVLESMAAIERTLAGLDARDPDAGISAIDAKLDALDTALAGARNQTQRLAHARDALAGALFTARNQIETTGSYIAGSRGQAGPQARTRLAEAERLRRLAEAEADPIAALDLARSSATYSRDADALARYDLMR